MSVEEVPRGDELVALLDTIIGAAMARRGFKTMNQWQKAEATRMVNMLTQWRTDVLNGETWS